MAQIPPWKELAGHYRRQRIHPWGGDKKEIRIMAFRPLIFGVLFIAVLVMIILSITWVDKSHPIRQPDPLAPSTTPSNPPPSVQ